ncbi:MAG: ABC transporter ATP-binding protein [Myxococcota bacterium]|jgi:ABC-2 type transport system ATP-binding protein|nr:ABC transporter ATP-binding protein [Myxococcota bacterium]
MSEEQAPLLRAEALRKRYEDLQAVDGLSLELHAGEIFGLIGPDGAGKSTTIRLLAGIVDPDEGAVFVMQEQFAGRAGKSSPSMRRRTGQAPNRHKLREHFGYMPQQYSLYGDLSIDENLLFFGRLFGLSRKLIDQRCARLLELTQLARFRARRADQLSGGMYKKLALACALLHQPRILLLDEPSNGVDPVSRRELWLLLHDFAREEMAILLSTPDMDEAARCHRLALLYQGKVLATGTPRELIAQAQCSVFVLHSTQRAHLEQQLSTRLPEALALSVEGEALRVVMRRGQEGALEGLRQSLLGEGLAVELQAVPCNFEDMFLAALAEQRHPRAA